MKIRPINRALDAEQYLESATNWHSLMSFIPTEDLCEGKNELWVTYDNRDYPLSFGDWVVRFPDGSLHFFKKAVFDELFVNPFAEPLRENEFEDLMKAVN